MLKILQIVGRIYILTIISIYIYYLFFSHRREKTNILTFH